MTFKGFSLGPFRLFSIYINWLLSNDSVSDAFVMLVTLGKIVNQNTFHVHLRHAKTAVLVVNLTCIHTSANVHPVSTSSQEQHFSLSDFTKKKQNWNVCNFETGQTAKNTKRKEKEQNELRKKQLNELYKLKRHIIITFVCDLRHFFSSFFLLVFFQSCRRMFFVADDKRLEIVVVIWFGWWLLHEKCARFFSSVSSFFCCLFFLVPLRNVFSWRDTRKNIN